MATHAQAEGLASLGCPPLPEPLPPHRDGLPGGSPAPAHRGTPPGQLTNRRGGAQPGSSEAPAPSSRAHAGHGHGGYGSPPQRVVGYGSPSDPPLPLGDTVKDFLPAGGTIRLGRLPDASEEDAIGEGGGEGGGRGGEAGGVGEWGPTAEVAAAAEAREAAAYSELLETLKELVDGEAKGPSSPLAKGGGGGGGGGKPGYHTPQMSEASSEVSSPRGGGEVGGEAAMAVADGGGAAAAELLAAGRMSGVADAPDDALLEMAESAEAGASQSADSLRKMLVASLGETTFQKAHSRLQTVVEEEDDDVLVQDIQMILGPERLDQLPMILKLIFLEGRHDGVTMREQRMQEDGSAAPLHAPLSSAATSEA